MTGRHRLDSPDAIRVGDLVRRTVERRDELVDLLDEREQFDLLLRSMSTEPKGQQTS